MPEAITLGPLLLPTMPLLVLACIVSAPWVAGRLGQRMRLNTQWTRRVAEHAVWLGLVGARLGFVVLNWSAYENEPWTALYVWQPGYSPYVGLVVGVGYVVIRLQGRSLKHRFHYVGALGGGFALPASIALLTVLLLSVVSGRTNPDVLRKGAPVPDFVLASLNGAAVRFSDLSGHVVVLNFWATWCPPCRREMPTLDAVYKKYSEMHVAIVGIDLGEPPEVVKTYIDTVRVGYPIWVDAPSASITTEALHRLLGGVGLPTTVFIGPDGMIDSAHVGELSKGLLVNRIEALLKEG